MYQMNKENTWILLKIVNLYDVKHGNVKIHYDDDDTVGSPVKTRPTLLNRIFLDFDPYTLTSLQN